MTKKTTKDLRDTVNQALGTGAPPSHEVMQQHYEEQRERNEKFQRRLRNNQGSPRNLNTAISREDWYAGMAMQALIQNAGNKSGDDASLPTVELVTITRLARLFAKEMIKEEEPE